MALNGVMAVIRRYFTEFDSFEANYVTVVKVRPTHSAPKNVAQRIYIRQYMNYNDILRYYSERVR